MHSVGESLLSLRSVIGLTITLIIAGIAILRGGMVGSEAEKLLRREIGASLSNVASGMADKLDGDMRARAHEVSVLASLDIYRDRKAVQSLVDDIRARDRDAAWIGVTDANGVVLAGSGGVLVGANIADRPVFRQAQNGLFVGDVHDATLLSKLLTNPSGEPMKFVDVSAPLKNPAGQISGVIAIHYSWSWAQGVIDSMLAFALDPTGLEVFVVAADDIVRLGPKEMIGKPLKLDSLAKSRAGERGSQVERWPDGGEYLTGYSAGAIGKVLGDLNWSVLVRRPVGQAFAPAQQMRSNIMVSGIALAVGFGGLGWLAAGWIARPLSVIAAAADRMRRGEHGAHLPDVGGARETRVLSRALRELVMSLTKSRSALVETHQALERMEDIAYQDRLTALPNRRFFEQYLDVALARARSVPHHMIVLYIDLDGFKPVNDSLGHDAGDEVLRQVGLRFASSLRQDDVVARIGGDEFAAVLMSSSDTARADGDDVCARFIAAINEPMYYNGETIRVGCSIGVAMWPSDSEELPQVLKHADEALYEAKRRGKRQAVIYADMITAPAG
jgi:diguanylate cyclase (GGDEF)-like protein